MGPYQKADRRDPGLSFCLRLRLSYSGFLVWLLVCGGGWLSVSDVEARSPKAVELQLVPGFCSRQQGCRLEGRLIRASRWLNNHNKASKSRSLMAAFRRFTRKRVRFAPIEVSLGAHTKHIFTDHRGYFQITLPFPRLPGSLSSLIAGTMLWRARHQPKPGDRTLPTQAQGYAVYPQSRGGISVVTDIDDTLIITHVTQKRKLLKQFLLRNASQIPVVPDALDFLRKVLSSPHQQGGGTLHYLTGSPFAIYDRLQRLFHLRRFPPGALHLKHLSGLKKAPLAQSYAYKLQKLQMICKMYPHTRFVLLGDSGEKDPEVYAQIRKQFPRQVAGIYIRAVPRSTFNKKRFQGMFVFHDYQQAIRHAQRAGLIK